MPVVKVKEPDTSFDTFVCPITRELPVRPVVAEDGKVYDEHAWKRYVKSFANKASLKSPWTKKKISKKAYYSAGIKNMIREAVKKGDVPKDLCEAWNERITLENKVEKLKKDLKKDAHNAMQLGDIYCYGLYGMPKSIEEAYEFYRIGWTRTGGKTTIKDQFFVKMIMLNALRKNRTRTDTICAWTSLCKMINDKLAASTVKKVIEKLSNHATYVASISHISLQDLTAKCATLFLTSDEDAISSECADELAGFLKENSDGTFESESDDSSEDSDSEN